MHFDRAPRLFHAGELLSLDALSLAYGGGFYRLWGYASEGGPRVAHVEAWIDGEPSTLDLDPAPAVRSLTESRARRDAIVRHLGRRVA